MSTTPLTRATHGRPAASVRIVHLGIGNFTRAHQAWYLEHATDAQDWGIAAFTGRRPTVSDLLTPQDGLYTLITKGVDGDSFEVISSLSKVHPASDFAQLVAYLESPDVVLLTTTVTEAGYCRASDGSLDTASEAVAADIAALSQLVEAGDLSTDAISQLTIATAPLRILAGLLSRRLTDAGAMTILPCDNLPDNGAAFRRVIYDAALAVDPSLAQWLDANVFWATCMVDRITPATTDEEINAVEREQGYHDSAPVPTEPFSEWVISGDFPAGRPDWQSAGATVVDDVEPYEQRKLYLLNGSHSLLAYAGPILGCETVAEAIGHPTLRSWVLAWWQEAGELLSIEWEEYADSLKDRFENPNIRHLLAQIAHDGSLKIPVRIAPTISARRAAGELPTAGARAVAAWVLHLRGEGAPVQDAAGDQVTSLVGGSLSEDIASVLDYLGLAGDPELAQTVAEAAEEILAAAR